MSTRSPETDAVFERRPATALDQPSRLQLVLAAGHAAETGVQVGKKTTDAKTWHQTLKKLKKLERLWNAAIGSERSGRKRGQERKRKDCKKERG